MIGRIPLLVAFVLLFLVSCVGRGVAPRTKKPEAIAVPAGTQVPALALAFDVVYDPKTDHVIPAYHMLNVGITNNSLQVIPLDPIADRWWLIDRTGHKHKGIISLRTTDPNTWASLPAGLKKLLVYPLVVPIATTQPIDLLFPARVNLNEFREVIFRSEGLDKEIHIYARE